MTTGPAADLAWVITVLRMNGGPNLPTRPLCTETYPHRVTTRHNATLPAILVLIHAYTISHRKQIEVALFHSRDFASVAIGDAFVAHCFALLVVTAQDCVASQWWQWRNTLAATAHACNICIYITSVSVLWVLDHNPTGCQVWSLWNICSNKSCYKGSPLYEQWLTYRDASMIVTIVVCLRYKQLTSNVIH